MSSGRARLALCMVFSVSVAACSILVGDGNYAVGSADRADGGVKGDAQGHVADGNAEAGEAPKPGIAAVSVSSGTVVQTWCAVTAGGDVDCWGDNSLGGLGNGTTRSSATPMTVPSLPPAKQVSVGAGTTCAVTKMGGVWCWGFGMDGELGNGSKTVVQTTPVHVEGLTGVVVDLSVGYSSVCAVMADGSVWCWGALGVVDPSPSGVPPSTSPVEVKGVSSATSVSVGADTVCAIVKGGALVCWGGYSNGTGLLGNGSTGGSVAPVSVMGLQSGVTSVSVGDSAVCAVATGAVHCWGDGETGELGIGMPVFRSLVPVSVPMLTRDVTTVAAGQYSVCALKKDGSVWCWGAASDGQLGDGTVQIEAPGTLEPLSGVPVQVVGPSGAPIKATSLSIGTAPCVVTTSGGIECWGLTSENAATAVPVAVLGDGGVSVSVGGSDDPYSFACAVNSGVVQCWGYDGSAQLGDGTPGPGNGIPVIISGSGKLDGAATQVSAGSTFACALSGGDVLCWGGNGTGQLGNGTTNSSLGPVLVTGLSGPTAVSAGQQSVCAITTGGALYCWGYNEDGELGNGSTITSTSPVAVSGLTKGVVAVSVGSTSACALLGDGTVDCWGNNSNGQLGNNSQISSLVPTPVPGLTSVTSIAVGALSACAATTTNIQCWGFGALCELGDGRCASSLSPVIVGNGLGGGTKVAVGHESACAIVDGGAWCWGGLALGNAQANALDVGIYPVQVTHLGSGVTDIAVGYSSACAVVHGGIQCWGSNSSGQLGNGGEVNHLVATPVPGFR